MKLNGSNYFRIKIAYSILLNKPIEIHLIRHEDINPGLTDYEISFLKLVERITNGTKIDISKTGTILKFFPGTITNNYGDNFEFQCDNGRSVSYYLEGILPIAMFGKETLECTLTGVTNSNNDISVDTFKDVTCMLMQKIVVGDTIKLDIIQRGVAPLGNGTVKFRCPIITNLSPFNWTEEGKVKRVRGLAFCSRLPNTYTTRMIDACRGQLNNFLPDVWIGVDKAKAKDKNSM
jgi:RNA 3'-terminal phosphate cyclase-like protein